MILSAQENSAVEFTAIKLLEIARQLPCRDAAKLLQGFLLVTDSAQFPELRALYQSLHACDSQLELLSTHPFGIAA